MSYTDAAVATVSVRVREMFDHVDGVLDMEDVERVHDMRVATRRLRAVLEIYAPCFPRKQLRGLLREVKDLADALGERRDPDVQLAALDTIALSVKAADFAGVALYAEAVRSRQWQGNAVLETALAHMRQSDLRGRLDALVDSAVVRS
jgi:CHAD domain-containing protein